MCCIHDVYIMEYILCEDEEQHYLHDIIPFCIIGSVLSVLL